MTKCKCFIAEKTRIHLWDLHAFIAMCRENAHYSTFPKPEHYYHGLAKVCMDCFLYAASVKTEVLKSYYQIYSSEKPTALLIRVHPGFIGRSSFSTEVEIYNAMTRELYVKNVITYVSVDRKTSKPKPLPSWFVDKYADVLSGTRLYLPKLLQQSQSDLTVIYSTSVKVAYSDIDSLVFHTHFIAYIKYAMQAAMEATTNGTFHGLFTVPQMDYIIKNMTVSYLGESKVGDVLDIQTWQNRDNKQKCYFIISLNGKSITHITLEFYENVLHSQI